MKFLIGSATVDVNAWSEDYSGEFVGDGSWEFAFKDLKLFADDRMDVFHEIEQLEEDETPEPDETLTVTDADSAILLLFKMGEAGGEYDVSYSSPGSVYWAYHDIDHARNDVSIVDGKAEIWVDGGAEDRAYRNGAILALDAGVSVADIMRELVKAEAEFRTRFGFDPTGLDAFCDSLESRLQKATV